MTRGRNYPLLLEESGDRYWVNGYRIDRDTYIAIRVAMNWVKTGETR